MSHFLPIRPHLRRQLSIFRSVFIHADDDETLARSIRKAFSSEVIRPDQLPVDRIRR